MKRVADAPLPRELKKIRLELDEAKARKKEAEAAYDALQRELDAHPETKAAVHDSLLASTRKQLPSFLAAELMDKDDPVFGCLTWLTYDETCDFAGRDPVSVWEIRMDWSVGKHRSYEIMMDDGQLYDEPVEGTFHEPPPNADLTALWREAKALNSKGRTPWQPGTVDLPNALAAFLVACKRARGPDELRLFDRSSSSSSALDSSSSEGED